MTHDSRRTRRDKVCNNLSTHGPRPSPLNPLNMRFGNCCTYIPNDGQLGVCVQPVYTFTAWSLISFIRELLIDFRERVGEHSGENMWLRQ